jgi:outer membrane protein TolC
MKFAATLLIALLPVVVHAQSAQAPLTLDAAIAEGLANSRRLAELEARGEAAEYAISGRKAADLPTISAQGGYTRTNHVDIFAIQAPGQPLQVVYPDIPDNFRARLDVQWPIYTGGRTDALERAARAERVAIGKDLDAARADLKLEITRAYWAAVTAAETEVVLRRSLDAVEAHLADVRARLDQGLVPPNDVSSAAAQAAHQRLLAIEATNLRGIAQADLARLVGRDSVTVTAAPPFVPPPAGAPAVADLISRALRDRAERQGLEQRVASAEERANAVQATKLPQVGVGGGYDYARPNSRIFPRAGEWKPSFDASVNVTWTLWDGGRRSAEYGEARANAAALKTRIEDFDRQVSFDVRARSLELASSREGVVAAEEEVRAAVDAERVVGERYKAGVATSTDVLDAQVARLQAELDRARAIANVRLAEARLERAIGR